MEKPETITLEENCTEFQTFWNAIEFYLTKAPTRQKSQTIEPVGGCKPSFHDFDKRHPARVYATLAIGFPKVYNELNAIEQMVYRWMLKKYPKDWGFPEIAKYHSVEERQLRRSKRYVKEKIEDFLISKELMPKPQYWQPAERGYEKGRAGRPKQIS
jgi:16S rRNA C967 or C1407 C5-methylase (RsmB/RsmF family)